MEVMPMYGKSMKWMVWQESLGKRDTLIMCCLEKTVCHWL